MGLLLILGLNVHKINTDHLNSAWIIYQWAILALSDIQKKLKYQSEVSEIIFANSRLTL